MTKFEQVGINMQYESATKEVAQKKFSRSCECCCNKGIHIECSRCAIAIVHQLVIASFETKED
jgi:hypothetical protein